MLALPLSSMSRADSSTGARAGARYARQLLPREHLGARAHYGNESL